MNDHIEDWQRGNDSTLTPLKRLELLNDWLKQNHKDVKKNIYLKEKEEELPPVGFVKL
jgi:hypothetical protein